MDILKFIASVLNKAFSVSKFNTFILLILFIFSAVLGTILPILLGKGMSYILVQQSVTSFLLLTAVFSFFWFLSSGIKYISYPLYGKIEQKAQSLMAVESLVANYNTDQRARSEQENSEVAFAIDAQMAVFRDVFSSVVMSLVPAITVLATGTASLWLTGGWQTALIYLLGILGFIFTTNPIVQQHQKAQGNFFSASMENFGTLSNAVGYWKEVAVFNLADYMSTRYQESRVPVEDKGVYSYKVTRKLYLLQSGFLTVLLGAVLTTYILVHYEEQPYILVGGFTALVGVCLYSIQTVQNIGFDFSALAGSFAQYKESQSKIRGQATDSTDRASAALDFSPLVGMKRGIVWVRGESGAGKSRSIEALLGFNTLVPVGDFCPHTFSDLRYLPQTSNLTYETANSIVRAGRDNLTEGEINTLLDSLGLGDFSKDGLRSNDSLGEHGAVSGGEARRITLARTLLGPDGALIVLDEPTAGIGATVRPVVWQLIREAALKNLVLVVTHDAEAPVEQNDILLEIKP